MVEGDEVIVNGKPLWVFIHAIERERDELRAIVSKLPLCWRLNGAGELVQDCPVTPGMKVYGWIHPGYNGLTYWVGSRKVEEPEIWNETPLPEQVVSSLRHGRYNSPAAAEAAAKGGGG